MTLRRRMIAAIGAIAGLIATGGCTVPGPLILPTAAAIRAPLVAAQASNAKAVELAAQTEQLAAKAEKSGIAAGSEEAAELSSLALGAAQEDAATQNQLSSALYQAGSLDRELAAKQAHVNAVVKDDQAQKARVVVLSREKLDWQLCLLALFILDFFMGGLIQDALRDFASFVCRAAFALGKHVIAFWPVLLACI